MVELRHWIAFVSVADAKTISAAAERLSLSQPALSKQLAELEESLGVRLFDRKSRGVNLTSVGKHLLPYGRRVVVAAVDAEEEAAAVHGLRQGRLEVSASTTIADYILPAAVATFASRYPGIAVDIRAGNTKEIAREVLADECEVGLIEGPLNDPALDFSPFFEDELVVVAPVGHALLKVRKPRAADLIQYRFVMRELGSGTRDVFEKAMAQHALIVPVASVMGSTEAVKRSVQLGLGLAVLSRLTVMDEVEAGTLEVVTVSDLKLKRSLSRIYRRERGLSRSARAFVSALEHSLRYDLELTGYGILDGPWDPVI